ncbi:MAG: glucose-6-phosphate dehydrogenase [Chloroflexi bacterium]|uniref:Glucose-6-phosphate 1-dehydrogenase n=1 Tax=Candidatus Chlorohelix allophototropha TaxID=3003348 RepID=A0A8T7M7Q6_9CHLR|nr:glucose-6-phosphate dehydrogenase [Chloroflexota bacterium]WJW68112.1 glucose-6-phosphate dehydrogenase [Chloroflexota bacterium L227-S17]
MTQALTTTATPAINPLRTGMRNERTPEPCVMVIFGATGDLTHRKLIPALYNLAIERYLPANFNVIGFARRPLTDEQFRESLVESINHFSRRRPIMPEVKDQFTQTIHFISSDFQNPEGYQRLSDLLGKLDQEQGTQGNRLFYLATNPSDYPVIIQNLGAVGLARPQRAGSSAWARIIVEKPIGHDLESAQQLNETVAQVFRENQVFRIDHYLGKETVQNILVFRFANSIFEPLWNRRYIDHIQMTVSEELGVEGRGPYYENSGTIRDMVQNHMMQLLSLVCMEPPINFDANSVRDEKVKVLRAIAPLDTDDVVQRTVRGQYGAGVIFGKPVKGYREEERVDPNSVTDTFVAIKLFVENWRWAGVPIYLRTGKRLPKRITEVALQFKPAPHRLFPQTNIEPSVLTLQIQPNDGISMRFGAKVPGQAMQIRPVTMDFRFGQSFGNVATDAYERLILDALLGDSTLFARRDEVEQAWTIVNSITDGWKYLMTPNFPNYESGTWGPKEADDFIEKDGRRWRRL